MATIDFAPTTLLLMTFSDGHSVAIPSNESTAYVAEQKALGVTMIFSSFIL